MFSLYFFELSKVYLYFLFTIFLTIFIIFLAFCVSLLKPDSEKLSSYECGFDPYEDARNSFDIRFYLVAILFLVFDLEAMFFFPWSVSFSFLSSNGFWVIIDFIIELFIGFIYAWLVGALDWK